MGREGLSRKHFFKIAENVTCKWLLLKKPIKRFNK